MPEAFPIPEAIPIFPLPDLVFFPRTFLPLHIFEPRYRQMVADAVAGGQCIGMALLKDGWEDDYYGNPPIHEVGCVGRLVQVHPLPDGRYNILLQGLRRYVIQDERFEKSYRCARVALTPGELGVALPPSLRSGLIERATVSATVRGQAAAIEQVTTHASDDETLVYGLASVLDLTAHDKQFVLEAEGVAQRARRLHDLLQLKPAVPHHADGGGRERNERS